MEMILSFDTEDFVTPQSDDALLMLATELTRHGIRGCFALVGDGGSSSGAATTSSRPSAPTR